MISGDTPGNCMSRNHLPHPRNWGNQGSRGVQAFAQDGRGVESPSHDAAAPLRGLPHVLAPLRGPARAQPPRRGATCRARRQIPQLSLLLPADPGPGEPFTGSDTPLPQCPTGHPAHPCSRVKGKNRERIPRLLWEQRRPLPRSHINTVPKSTANQRL